MAGTVVAVAVQRPGDPEAQGGGTGPSASQHGVAICLRELGGTRPLTRDEETRLAEAVRAGDRQAAIQLVEANLRLVVSVARRYQDRGVPFIDLVQEGNLGLVRAVRGFDLSRGCRFATYAYWCIRQAVRDAVAERGRLVPVPSATRLVTLRRLAEPLDSPEERMPPPDDVVLDWLRIDLHAILLVLTPRERRVLQLRYGLLDGRPLTQEEIGRRLGITRQRVCQIEKLALARLRSAGGGQVLAMARGPRPALGPTGDEEPGA